MRLFGLVIFTECIRLGETENESYTMVAFGY